MKQAGRRIIALLLAAYLALPGLCLVAHGEPETTPENTENTENAETVQEVKKPLAPGYTMAGAAVPEVSCPQALCYDMEYGKVLYERDAAESIAPAGFTKLMTALLAFEYRAETGNVDVTVTEDMLTGILGGGIHLKVGEVIDLDSLLRGLVLYNANDAAQALATVVSGSISNFVERMNQRAEELGMNETYFNNPTGVDAAMMHTTLRDVLILCQTLYRINDFMNISSEEKGVIPPTNLSEERYFTNRNALIPFSYVTDYMVKGARGFIAGYTVMAGYVCASCRSENGANTIVLLAGGEDLSEEQNGTEITTYRDAARLLDWARDEFTVMEIIEKETVLCEKKVRLSGGVDHTVLVTGSAMKTLLPKSVDPKRDIRVEIRAEDEVLDAPVLKGAKYGEADLYLGEELLGTVDLVAQANVSLSRMLMVWDGVVRFFSAGPARVFLIIVISSAALYLLILIITVYVQYLRNTRERRQVLREMEERENRRLREVRRTERERAQRTMRLARSAVREGYRVFSGQSDALGSGKAVARVPEKYRKAAQAQRQLQVVPRQATPERRPQLKTPRAVPAGNRRVTPTAQRTGPVRQAAPPPKARPVRQAPPRPVRAQATRPAPNAPKRSADPVRRGTPARPTRPAPPKRPVTAGPVREQRKQTVKQWPD